jgi:hypothetical protein
MQEDNTKDIKESNLIVGKYKDIYGLRDFYNLFKYICYKWSLHLKNKTNNS